MNINLLVIVRWPLGGIRTYMKYVYRHLPAKFRITILAASTHEDDALRADAEILGARLLLVRGNTRGGMAREIIRELGKTRYDLIQSHGFISAIHTYLANTFFRLPHVLTVHGILEERYLTGAFGRIKKALLAWVIKRVTVVYAVSNDILLHLREQIPSIDHAACRLVVVPNGIDPERFTKDADQGDNSLRNELGLGNDVFLLGFLGRFMPQKGLNFLIDALEILENRAAHREIHVIAVGSGDYLPSYQKMARDKGVAHRFIFMPFRQDVSVIYQDVDAVVMPSIWEACPLQPMEAMCSGTPVIASDCIGLRETVADTPAIVVPTGDAAALADAIERAGTIYLRTRFVEFAPLASERYDVRKTSLRVEKLFEEIVSRQ